MKKLLFLLCLLFFATAAAFAQLITNVHVYEPSNSKFTSYDIDAQNNIYFGGYLRTAVFTQDTIGNIPFTGYWYEDGMTFRADTTGFINWITVTGSYDGLEDTKSIRYLNGSVYCAGNFIVSGGQIFVNSVGVPFSFSCCYNGYVMKQSETGVFEWLYPLQYTAYDMEIDNTGNSYVCGEGYLKKINSLGTEVWSVPSSFNYSEILLHNDTIYEFGTFQDSITLFGNTFHSYGATYDVDACLTRFTTSGNFIDIIHIGSKAWDLIHDIAEDANGDIWISGYAGDSAYVGGDALCGSARRLYFAKLDDALHVQQCDNIQLLAQQFGSGTSGEMVFNAANECLATLNMHDTIVINADTLSFEDVGGYEGGCLLAKWDTAGNLMWYRPLATPTFTSLDVASVSAHVRKTLNGKYFLAGQMRTPNMIDGISYDSIHYYEAFFASLTDTTFIAGVNDQPEKDFEIAFENPVVNKLTISSGQHSMDAIEIFNVVGERVAAYRGTKTLHQVSIDVSMLSTGIYFFKLMSDEKTVAARFIKI